MLIPSCYRGRGSQLQVSLDNQNFTPAVQLTQFEPSGSKQTMLDQTNMGSPGRFLEEIPVLVTAGDVDCQGVLQPQDPVALLLGRIHGQLQIAWFRVILIDGTTYSFRASVSEFKPFSVKLYSALNYSFKLRIVGGIDSPRGAFQFDAFDPDAFDIELV